MLELIKMIVKVLIAVVTLNPIFFTKWFWRNRCIVNVYNL